MDSAKIKASKPSYSFYELKFFEDSVIKYNDKNQNFYILSYKYNDNDKYGINLSNLSIFDNEKRGTIKQDKEKVNKVLDILMSSDSPKKKLKKLEELNINEQEKKGIGCMLGMAIGDAMGARYEFQNVRYGIIDLKDMGKGPGGKFKLQPGQWTDDTSMGLCIADSLLMNNGKLSEHDIMHRFIAWWRGGYNNAFRYNKSPRHSVGLGGNISLSFRNYLDFYNKTKNLANPKTNAGDENTSGNGSIMRNAAIPICFHKNINLAMEMQKSKVLLLIKELKLKNVAVF